jgi:3-hydroxyacyl-CoA dehydrogenase/3a,7a,12a-trihydroxy-5b-cholest-24-enoyl-CoA hydratase
MYALGVGAGDDPSKDNDLQLVYEMHGKGFRAVPSFAVIPAVNQILDLAKSGKSAPGFNFGIDRLLHGEQYTELVRPLPPKATLTHKSKVENIFDKGKNALIEYKTESFDEDGNLLITNRLTAVIRGAGGWGGERGPSEPRNVPPDRKPDEVVEQSIGLNQALLYRLSGDWNPLHVDPNMARAFGFEKPILHGLCTYGYATRHVINRCFPDMDPRYFKSIQVRFADSVYPGETLVTEMWRDGDNRVVFSCKVKERDKVVISNAAIERYSEIPKPAPKKKAAQEPEMAGKSASAPKDDTPSADDVFIAIQDYVERNPEIVAKIGVVYQFKLSDPESVWTLDAKSGTVGAGELTKPECTLELSNADFLGMTQGTLDPQELYFSGKLKISGNVMASQKLTFLQKIDPEQAKEAVRKAKGGGASAKKAAAPTKKPSAKAREAAAPMVFDKLQSYISEHGDVVKNVGATMQWLITGPDSSWALDFKKGKGSVEKGTIEGADATFTISDEDFLSLVKGEAKLQSLFQRGQLRVDGDVRVAHRLEFLTKLI